MSYEIIKNCRIRPNIVNDGWHAVITCASNNLRPLYYEECTIGINENMSKEEIEKLLLLEFFHGNFQRGTSKYNRTVIAIQNNAPRLLDKYYRYDKVLTKVSMRMWKLEDRTSVRYHQLSALCSKLRQLRDNNAKDVLYKYMQDSKNIKSKVKPFTIQDNVTGEYVVKVNPRTYRVGFKPHPFTSAKLYQRVTRPDSWWLKHFTIRQECEV